VAARDLLTEIGFLLLVESLLFVGSGRFFAAGFFGLGAMRVDLADLREVTELRREPLAGFFRVVPMWGVQEK
jgi:hypothetical protein